jgi:hypothetical protein
MVASGVANPVGGQAAQALSSTWFLKVLVVAGELSLKIVALPGL